MPSASSQGIRRGRPRAARGWVAAALLVLCAAPHLVASAIAVKRGQKVVDPKSLPLVCLEIGTYGASIPVDSITLENVATHETQRLVLANTFNPNHPDMLTAAANGDTSLSLPILRLKPGRYRVVGFEFVAGGASVYYLDLPEGSTYWFEVLDGCVNYVGGIEITAVWPWLRSGYDRSLTTTQTTHTRFGAQIVARAVARRDVKWACDVVPGLLPLPSALSVIHVD
jgi:hypothetical protein